MGRSSELAVIDRLFRWGAAVGDDDACLLERFRVGRDEAAFAALVDRHGPMVLGVCRRVLRDDRDVEDAFQATFLILARRSATIRGAGLVGPWLHGVAHRVATRARADSARRFVREGARLEVEPPAEAGQESERRELRAIVDDELRRLPCRFRDPVVLCHLEGLTHDQAADRLRLPVGTVRSRLARARTKLRDRLERRGLSAADAPALLPLAEPLPPALLEATLRSCLASATAPATTLAAAGAVALADGVLQAMIFSKAKLAAVALGTLLTLGGASGYALQQGGDGGASPPAESESRPPDSVSPGGPNEAPDRDEGAIAAELATKLGQLESQRDSMDDSIQRAWKGLKSQRETMLRETTVVARMEIESRRLKSEIEGVQKELRRLRAETAPAADDGATKVEPPAIEDPSAAKASDEALAGRLRAYLVEIEDAMAIHRMEARVLSGTLESNKQIVESVRRQLERLESGQTGDTGASNDNVGPGEPSPAADAAEGHRREGGDQKAASPGGRAMSLTPAGGMGMAAGGNAQPGRERYIAGPQVVIVPSSNGRVLTGYSLKHGWARSLRIAPDESDVQVDPIIGPGVATVQIKGAKVERIAAFSSSDGEWHTQELREPTDQATPQIGPGLVAYPIGRLVYAFGATTNRWDVLEPMEELKPWPVTNFFPRAVGDATPPPRQLLSFMQDSIMCQDEHKLHIFSGQTGTWTSIPLEASEAAEKPKP